MDSADATPSKKLPLVMINNTFNEQDSALENTHFLKLSGSHTPNADNLSDNDLSNQGD